MTNLEKARDHGLAQDVDTIFTLLLLELSPGKGKPGPSPDRIQRLADFIRERGDLEFTLSDLAVPHYDAVDPRKSASSALSSAVNMMNRWGLADEYGVSLKTRRETFYRFVR